MALISIIVPVYQVEEYLRQCINSILNQTYSDLEIILVDDGSKDNSGEICDEYAQRDSRVRVIHKENGGLSSARNVGLMRATGEFIGFVDSDDWLEPKMYEIMYDAIAEKGDIAICNYFYDALGTEHVIGCKKSFTIDSYQALEILVSDKTPNYAWNKLFRRSLFKGIIFPEGRNFEDVAIMYLLFERAKFVSFLNEALYHYRYRKSGIIGVKRLSNMLDYCEFRLERYRYCEAKYPDLRCKHIRGIADATIRMAAASIRCSKSERKKNIQRRHAVREFYDKNIAQYSDMLNKIEKIIFYLDTREHYMTDVLAVGLEVIRRKIYRCRNQKNVQ